MITKDLETSRSFVIMCSREKYPSTFRAESNEKPVYEITSEKLSEVFFRCNFVGFSRGREVECFVNNEVRKQNTNLVTENVLAFPAKSTEDKNTII